MSSSSQHTRPESWVDRIIFLGFKVSVLFLLYVIGSLGADRDWAVSQWIRDASTAAQAIYAQIHMGTEVHSESLWFVTSTDEQGLVVHDAERSEPGLTLFTSADAAQALLLNEQGETVHRWHAPFSQVWPHAPQQRGYTPDHGIYIRRAHAYPDGELLALYESPLQTPNGCGLAKLDKDSHVIWKLDANTHHDFDVADNGEIFVLTHGICHDPISGWEWATYPLVEEFLTVVSPEGEAVKSMSLFKLLAKSPFHVPVVSRPDHLGDVMHSNTVNVIGHQFASHHELVEPGDLMVCLRNFNLVIIVRPETETIVWASTGPWRYPHDPDPLANGNILIFDNCYSRGGHHGSRVVEFDPSGHRIAWQFIGSDESPLKSNIRSCQQRLPGGNVLITESDCGRILEVTRSGDIVWEYVYPVRAEDGRLAPVVSGARRYTRSELPFVADAK